MINKKNALERLYVAILVAIFGGIVLHAPISVGLSSLWPDYNLLIKSWKEILMVVASCLAVFLTFKNKRIDILKKPVIGLIAAFFLLHLILLLFSNTTMASLLAGLMIDLRYLLFFVLIYVAINLYPNYRKLFIKVGVIGAFVVCIFALLQVFILPYDVLKYVGYNKHTIIPYLVVDQNYSFIRINSTMRGPNPLGAYAVIVLALLVAKLVRTKYKIINNRHNLVKYGALSIGAAVALWSSYSRSAVVGAIIAILAVFLVSFKKISVKFVIICGFIFLLIAGGLFMARDTHFVSNIILHDNPDSAISSKSNDGHVNSLVDGAAQMINQPFGAGIGSTGSASLLGSNPDIIENQYLYTAHESGWLGLTIFTAIYGIIMTELWKKRRDWFALGIFASGIGLALIGLLLPVWADDAVSIIWWGAAAAAIVGYKKVNDIER